MEKSNHYVFLSDTNTGDANKCEQDTVITLLEEIRDDVKSQSEDTHTLSQYVCTSIILVFACVLVYKFILRPFLDWFLD